MRAQSLAPTKKPLLGERWHRVAITERGLIAKHNDSSPLSVAYGDSRPRGASHLPIIFFIIERSFADGTTKYKAKNFNGIKTDAALDKVYEAGTALGGLMEKPYKDIELTEKSELAEA